MERTKVLHSLPAYLTEWLICLKSVLKPTGSLYFYSDSTASQCFRNKIMWKRNHIRSKRLATREQTTSTPSYSVPLKSHLLTGAKIKAKFNKMDANTKYSRACCIVFTAHGRPFKSALQVERLLQSTSLQSAIEQGTVRRRILKREQRDPQGRQARTSLVFSNYPRVKPDNL